jgi:hypothetical protein
MHMKLRVFFKIVVLDMYQDCRQTMLYGMIDLDAFLNR